MPRLWEETIETHRRAVHDAIVSTAWRLVARHGALSVTMSQVASETGIGRATLYKYFPDVASILAAHHREQVEAHLEGLYRLRDHTEGSGERLDAVLHELARINHHRGKHGAGDLVALLHSGSEVTEARAAVHRLVTSLVVDAAKSGLVRTDVSASELAGYCVHALGAAGDLASEKAVGRLVSVVLDSLRPDTHRA